MDKKKVGILLILALGGYALYANSKKKKRGSIVVDPVQKITSGQFYTPPTVKPVQTPVIQTSSGQFFTPQYTNTYSPLPSLSDTSYDPVKTPATNIFQTPPITTGTDYSTMAGMGEIARIMAENENVSVGYAHHGRQYWLHKRQRCHCRHKPHHRVLNNDHAENVINRL